MINFLRKVYRFLKALLWDARFFPSRYKAHKFAKNYTDNIQTKDVSVSEQTNPLWEYFKNHKEGHGIWKWEHYFDIYHRHFARFVGQKVNVLEIGVYSGGSLEMWREYFGEKCHIYGVDIEEACKVYENDYISISIGDQADRNFWKDFTKNTKGIDILIDDGGHTPQQQRITLEEMLPQLRPGGVFLCEDVHAYHNKFSAFASGLVHELNCMKHVTGAVPQQSRVTQFQSSIYSIHFYPYVVVIEKNIQPRTILLSPKHGTKWQPFLDEQIKAKTGSLEE